MSHRQSLEELAWLHGVSLDFWDIYGNRRVASDDALLAILPGLGAAISGPQDVEEAVRAKRIEVAEQRMEPVNVVWDDAPHRLHLRLPSALLNHPIGLSFSLEGGDSFNTSIDPSSIARHESWVAEGRAVSNLSVPLSRQLPWGYHRVRAETAAGAAEAMVISAPKLAWTPEECRVWGLFAPTYAISDRDTQGMGSLRELRRLIRWTQARGGALVGTLPMMSTFLDDPFAPSPYSPVSRIFWNELFLDVEALPELKAAPAARARAKGPATRETEWVDYKAQYAHKREQIEPLLDAAFKRSDVQAFIENNPRTVDYARFRATHERERRGWCTWEARKAGGVLKPGDYDERAFRFHLYSQMRMKGQLDGLNAESAEHGLGLYLDMPLGVHPDGYDAWRHSDCFLQGASAGAPPDALSTEGQNWGFRPLHPQAIRREGYEYVRACVRSQMTRAGALRIDHVLGLHRIFSVPFNMSGNDGVYVNYAADELYAIMTLESHRHRCMVVGEDLGTIPDEVRVAMDAHHFHRMYVGQFALSAHEPAIGPVPDRAVASINTHDTPTFGGFWGEHDIEQRLTLGHLSAEQAPKERAERAALRAAVTALLAAEGRLSEDPSAQQVLRALIERLAESSAHILLVNLEDLFDETTPQNVPGTIDEVPNWRHKVGATLEQLEESEDIAAFLERLGHRMSGQA